MKALLPILICSIISAGLGYYFGHITLAPEGVTKTKVVEKIVVQPTTAAAPVQQSAPPAPSQVAASNNSPVNEPAIAVETEPERPEITEADMAERAKNTIQTLTDSQGRSIQAKILDVTADSVKIERTDGLETTIPFSMLSETDVEFCNYLKENDLLPEIEQAPAPAADDGEFDWNAYFNS